MVDRCTSTVHGPMCTGRSISYLEAGGGREYAADLWGRKHLQPTRIAMPITHARREQVCRGLARASAHREGVSHGDERLCAAVSCRAGAEPPMAAVECLMVAAS